MLPWIKHAFRPGRRFHEIIRKWVSHGQSIQTGRHYLQDNFFLNFLLYEIFKEKELRYKLTPIQTQTKAKPHTNLHPLKPNKHTNLQDNFFFLFFFYFLLYAIFKKKEELRCKLIQTQTRAKPHTNLHPLKPNKHIKQSM